MVAISGDYKRNRNFSQALSFNELSISFAVVWSGPHKSRFSSPPKKGPVCEGDIMSPGREQKIPLALLA